MLNGLQLSVFDAQIERILDVRVIPVPLRVGLLGSRSASGPRSRDTPSPDTRKLNINDLILHRLK